MGNARRPVTLETLTIAPRDATSAGAAARISRNGARALMSSISSHCSSVVVSAVPFAMMPAALTSAEMPPKAESVSDTIRSGASAWVTSATTTAVRPPSRSTCTETSRSAAALRATRTTEAPARPNRSAVARPMPLEAPVTITVWLVVMGTGCSTGAVGCADGWQIGNGKGQMAPHYALTADSRP